VILRSDAPLFGRSPANAALQFFLFASSKMMMAAVVAGRHGALSPFPSAAAGDGSRRQALGSRKEATERKREESNDGSANSTLVVSHRGAVLCFATVSTVT
jgi:hypothetical protein